MPTNYLFMLLVVVWFLGHLPFPVNVMNVFLSMRGGTNGGNNSNASVQSAPLYSLLIVLQVNRACDNRRWRRGPMNQRLRQVKVGNRSSRYRGSTKYSGLSISSPVVGKGYRPRSRRRRPHGAWLGSCLRVFIMYVLKANYNLFFFKEDNVNFRVNELFLYMYN